jgi:hypothetical protein
MTGKQLRSLLIAEQLKHSIDCDSGACRWASLVSTHRYQPPQGSK